MIATTERYRLERKILQYLVGGTSVFPLFLGGSIALTGIDGMRFMFNIEIPMNPTLDSNIRFLGANFFGMGMVLVWIVLRIEERTVPLRIAIAAIALGGASRLVSMFLHGSPGLMAIGLTGIEFLVISFAFWQHRIAAFARGQA